MPVTTLSPSANFGSQLDRAICAFLIANDCGDESNVNPSYSIATNAYPITTVKSYQSQHDPMLTGRDVYQVEIEMKQSAVTASGNPNPEFNRAEIDALVGAVMAAMMQSNDANTLDYTARQITLAGRALNTGSILTDGQNNSDMSDFTVDHIYFKGSQRGDTDEEGTAWIEKRTFECHGCPANVD